MNRLLCFPLFCAGLLCARAEVTLAPLFTDHAVLQRDKLLPVWGRADAGETVTVVFAGQTHRTRAAADGRWCVLLDPLPANAAGADLNVSGKNSVTVRDVVVGEVWLCAGQSNMEFTVEARAGTWQARTRVANASAEIAAAQFPLIRHVRIGQQVAERPADTVPTGGWEPASPQTVGGFTAVGYFFAREIFQKTAVPIGIVNASWGGTPIESWLSPAAFAGSPSLGADLERWRQTVAAYPAARAAYESALAAWTAAEAAARTEATAAGAKQKPKNDGRKIYAAWLAQHPRPRAPRGPGDPWTPAGLFNGMINPLLPYGVRGILWYQGENNVDRAADYAPRFAALIGAWRGHFGQGEVPFYWVNLAAFKYPADPTGQAAAWLRAAQTQTLSLPQTGQAVAIDLGLADDIHPTNKQDVGRRLALLAKGRLYGATVDDTGPTFASATREGAALRVRFTHANGLIAHDKPVQSLEVAGADRRFFPAKARIDRDTLLVAAPEVPEPVAVRYAWKNAPEANLYNGAGLPAVPFRSDTW